MDLFRLFMPKDKCWLILKERENVIKPAFSATSRLLPAWPETVLSCILCFSVFILRVNKAWKVWSTEPKTKKPFTNLSEAVKSLGFNVAALRLLESTGGEFSCLGRLTPLSRRCHGRRQKNLCYTDSSMSHSGIQHFVTEEEPGLFSEQAARANRAIWR